MSQPTRLLHFYISKFYIYYSIFLVNTYMFYNTLNNQSFGLEYNYNNINNVLINLISLYHTPIQSLQLNLDTFININNTVIKFIYLMFFFSELIEPSYAYQFGYLLYIQSVGNFDIFPIITS